VPRRRAPTAPSTWFSSSTAAVLPTARRDETALPGGNATAACAFASAVPIRVIASAGTSLSFAAASGVAPDRTPVSNASYAPAPAPAWMAARASASASMPSLPGRAGSQSSAEEAVSERREPT
jgi:hypothetical protein